MKSYDVIIIGAGAAGMVAAIAAASEGRSVLLLEKMERAGRKIRITGKGRCNITNTKDWDEFATHIYPNSRFFRSSFFHFNNEKTVSFFESIGLPLVVERGGRVFPQSMNAGSVTDALICEMDKRDVEILYNSPVKDIIAKEDLITTAIVENRCFSAKTFIVATGGKSYPLTGSSGDGYCFAERLGHRISPTFPSLTAIMPAVYKQDLCGLELKNVELTLFVDRDAVQQEFGDLLFTENGIEGPIGLRVSRRCVKALLNGQRVSAEIDLKPALNHGKLISRVEREFINSKVISIRQLLTELLPRQLIMPFAEYNCLDTKRIISICQKSAIENIVEALKSWRLEISDYTGYERAVVTAGGVALDDVVSKTLKSKIYKNLFFAGEVIDLDGDTGGYNLQIAFSTGHLAAISASHLIENSVL